MKKHDVMMHTDQPWRGQACRDVMRKRMRLWSGSVADRNKGKRTNFLGIMEFGRAQADLQNC